jgi:hypothetical protein
MLIVLLSSLLLFIDKVHSLCLLNIGILVLRAIWGDVIQPNGVTLWGITLLLHLLVVYQHALARIVVRGDQRAWRQKALSLIDYLLGVLSVQSWPEAVIFLAALALVVARIMCLLIATSLVSFDAALSLEILACLRLVCHLALVVELVLWVECPCSRVQ